MRYETLVSGRARALQNKYVFFFKRRTSMNEFGEIVNIFDLTEKEIDEHMTCMLEW